MIWTLAATAGATATSGVVYLALAAVLWTRRVVGDPRFATRAFASYWALTGCYQLLIAAQHLLAGAGFAPFLLALFVRLAGLGLAAGGIAALLVYFAYLRTGTRRATPWILGAYGVALVASWLHVVWSLPSGVAVTTWAVDVSYAGDFLSGPFFVPAIVTLQVVPILGAAWYLTLVRSTHDPRQRRRILAVGLGIGLQLTAFLLARFAGDEPWQLVSRTIMALVVAGLVAFAYRSAPTPTRREVAA